ncbi:MAG: Ig-like domain-containing protein [Prolixibacteraceae bacterium]|nr:Ig-like domain-containing protein [Prolixibacteraceae bacterium]
MKQIIPILIIIWFGYLVFFASCANTGMPTGGPKDTISPVLVSTVPKYLGTNYKGSDIRLTFNEYVVYDDLSQKLVVSPPMKKKPLFKSKGKTLIVEFREELKDSTTYSLDFKDAVADNNEKNPYEDLRFAFSTGPGIDTLQAAGYVKNAFDLEPVEDALVVLHRLHDPTAFFDSIPDYIGKTDKEGYFEINNIARDTYRLYAIVDGDNSLTYNQTGELIAFVDSLITPDAKYIVRNDTIVENGDTLAVHGEVEYYPGIQYLLLFEEEVFDQYLDSYNRPAPNYCTFVFSESLSDSFKVDLLEPGPTENWLFIESNLKHDSLTFWITDTLISNVDTLKMKLRYEVKDSLDAIVMKYDTLDLVYKRPQAEPKQRRKKKETEEIPQISISHNIKPKGHDIFQKIILQAPEPLQYLDTSMVHLYHVDDTVKTKLKITVEPDSMSIRRFFINYPWEPEENYFFSIDSAAARNIYGHPSRKVEQKFSIQEERYYGSIVLNMKGLNGPAIIQLIDNSKEEKVLQKIQVLEEGEITFPYLKPEKYKVKVIFDANKNGKWDTGHLGDGIQPERVMYYPKVLKIKGNFEFREDWKPEIDPNYGKEVIDEDKIKEEEATKKKQLQLN